MFNDNETTENLAVILSWMSRLRSTLQRRNLTTVRQGVLLINMQSEAVCLSCRRRDSRRGRGRDVYYFQSREKTGGQAVQQLSSLIFREKWGAASRVLWRKWSNEKMEMEIKRDAGKGRWVDAPTAVEGLINDKGNEEREGTQKGDSEKNIKDQLSWKYKNRYPTSELQTPLSGTERLVWCQFWGVPT
jgi:hypothetical protein